MGASARCPRSLSTPRPLRGPRAGRPGAAVWRPLPGRCPGPGLQVPGPRRVACVSGSDASCSRVCARRSPRGTSSDLPLRAGLPRARGPRVWAPNGRLAPPGSGRSPEATRVDFDLQCMKELPAAVQRAAAERASGSSDPIHYIIPQPWGDLGLRVSGSTILGMGPPPPLPPEVVPGFPAPRPAAPLDREDPTRLPDSQWLGDLPPRTKAPHPRDGPWESLQPSPRVFECPAGSAESPSWGSCHVYVPVMSGGPSSGASWSEGGPAPPPRPGGDDESDLDRIARGSRRTHLQLTPFP